MFASLRTNQNETQLIGQLAPSMGPMEDDSIHYNKLHKICLDLISSSDTQSNGKIEWNPNAQLALTKIVATQIATIGLDLEAFSKHAKRSTITVDDVRLLLRRHPQLLSKFNQESSVPGAPSEKAKDDNKTNKGSTSSKRGRPKKDSIIPGNAKERNNLTDPTVDAILNLTEKDLMGLVDEDDYGDGEETVDKI